MMTYDESEEVRALAHEHKFQVEAVPMKNTHHAVMHELVITNFGSCMDMRVAQCGANYLKRRLMREAAIA